MKRLWVAISLLAISIFFATFENIMVLKNYNRFTPILDKAEEYCSENEFLKAYETIESAQLVWEKKSKVLNSLIDHTHVDNINESFFQLLESAQKQEQVEFLSICNKTKRQLLSMKESELPSFDNIM